MDVCRVFNKTWTAKYFFTEIKGKAVCLICGTLVVVLKDYNLNHHYTTKHEDKYRNLSDEECVRESVALLEKLQNPTRTFYETSHPQMQPSGQVMSFLTKSRFLTESLFRSAYWTLLR